MSMHPQKLLRVVWFACISACGVGQSHSADAADISIRRCSPTTSSELLIHGEIDKGDATRFTGMADELGKDTNCPRVGSPPNGVPAIFVKLDSRGGDIIEALAIGREVRRRFMTTGVVRNMECDSACVFILAAGVERVGDGTVGLHRPAFDPTFFAGLSPTAARDRYNSLVENLRQYYIEQMGGSPEAFQIMMITSSTSIRYLSLSEMLELRIIGEDPAWAEYNEAQFIQRYGRERWTVITACLKDGREFNPCVAEAYRLYPER
jgi:hypothetical protein